MSFGLLSYLAADVGPTVHVAPAGVFTIGGWTITNSILYGWICSIAIVAFLIWVARRVTVKPQGGIIQFIEAGVDFITNLVENSFDDKKVGHKYVPFFVTLFFFIILNNWLGLLPFVGEGFSSEGHPLLRPFTGDLNGTLAIGVVTMLMVYGASILEAGGPLKYLKHFFIGSPLNPLYFVIGLLEMFTDLTRVLSLSLRLFLNITIGEIVIAVFAYLGSIAAPLTALPFTMLEVLVAALQAYIFTILATMYLAIAVNHTSAHPADDDLTDAGVPETIGVQTAGGSARG
ncbi:ATP synthase F0 subunit A [Candidatus Saccharibacteria bacterium CG_4_10_14_0_2_um_filter_52_9]|nr:MAG: ATP synthase F0 subunit A [Candidatus Saccharibacteria bacterium CG_4_10_14_0_2_um_filter_52_9]